jgi:DNA-binding response OmpR family regulator
MAATAAANNNNNNDSDHKPRILVVDDEQDIVVVLKLGLKRHGYDVDGFSDPREALAQFQPKRYDFIILDIKMPYINGYELYRQLTKIEREARIGFMSAFETNLADLEGTGTPLTPVFIIRKPASIQRIIEQMRPFISR